VAAAFIGGAAAGAVVSLVLTDNASSSSGTLGSSATDDAVTRVVEQANPSVVTIVDEGPTQVDDQGRPFQSVSVGSGVIVDTRGYIVTNEHVVHDPGTLSVVLDGGEQRPATLVSSDAPFTDLAVLKIAAGNLRAASFGDSGALKVGQTVIAMGSALYEYRNSVSVGVVSGLGRRYFRQNIFMDDLIQTDASINNGNSGGPLLNTAGQVVGLTANVVRRIGNDDKVFGISFALSSNTIEPIVKSIIDTGSFPRPYFGIDHLDIDADVAAQQDLPTDQGALVQKVFGGSPADVAGLRVGDIILRLGSQDLDDNTPFLNALLALKPGDRIDVQFLRDGRQLHAIVAVRQR
jgi:S1-C subfamily serine protease